MIAAERKHAMADLARGVSHDLNNALGSVLPLVQQLCEEASTGRLEPNTCSEDLKQIERSLHTCRRIFSGMLTFARRAATSIGHGHVRQAVDGTLAILEEGMRQRGIDVSIEIAESLPTINGGQSELEQVMLNLVHQRARRDARRRAPCHHGCRGRGRGSGSRWKTQGCGSRSDVLPRIAEPFFTTKPNGSGLGLSICRSIVWDMGGEMRFESRPGKGTRVMLLLPTSGTAPA